MFDLNNPDKRIQEIVYALRSRNDLLDINGPSYGDVTRALNLVVKEIKSSLELNKKAG